jgi:hypothetical protein
MGWSLARGRREEGKGGMTYVAVAAGVLLLVGFICG